MDGWVTIGTKVDNKQLEKDLKAAESRLKQYEREAEKLTDKKAKIEVDTQAYEEEKRLIQERTDANLQFAQTEEQIKFLLDSENIELEQLNGKYSTQFQQVSDIDKKIKENAHNQALVNNEISKLNTKLGRVKGFDGIKSSIQSVGKEVQKVSKRIVGWGLALIGMRSIISLVRQSFSTLAEYNSQLSSDIEYIRYALANALAPVIQWIMGLVKKLMFYVGYIAKAWFGVSIFANASAQSFKNAKDNLGKSAKSAKDLKNQLAGFDEMNVLSDSSSSSSDNGEGTALPSFDLSQIQGEAPGWIDWIAKNKDIVIAALAGITAGLLAMKLGLTGIKALGIGVAVAGIVYAIQGLLKYLKDPSWENFGQIIQGIGIAVIGLGIAFLGLPAIITGVIVLIVGTIIKYWDQIKAFFQKGIDWLKEKSDWIRKTFGDTFGEMYDGFVSSIQMILVGFDNLFKGIKQIFDGIIKLVTGVFSGDWSKAWEGIKQIFKGIFQSLLGIAQVVLNTIIATVILIATTVGSIIAEAFKAVVNGVLWAIETILNTPIRAINGLIKIINKIPGIELGTLKEFKLPRLAKGGIINQPGKGVPLGSAIGGERGAEGVIPLTDAQQMALLGEAIGRYITINANITNTMNGRVISRELQKINNESDFAYNR